MLWWILEETKLWWIWPLTLRVKVDSSTHTGVCAPRGHSGHGLCTLTAVFRSTQPSTLRGMVKWVSAYELSNNNKWRWCLRMVAANPLVDSQPKLVCLVWGLAATRRSVCIHQMNWVNSCNDYVMMTAPYHCQQYYYYYYFLSSKLLKSQTHQCHCSPVIICSSLSLWLRMRNKYR